MGLSDIHFFLIDGKTNQTSKTKASRNTINLGLNAIQFHLPVNTTIIEGLGEGCFLVGF
jgi:hypothetical protein